MRILLPTEYYPPFVRGGGEISTKIIAEELAKKHDITVLTPNYWSRFGELHGKDSHVKVHRFQFPFHTTLKPKNIIQKKKPLFHFLHNLYIKLSARNFRKNIEKYDKKHNLDIVHAQNLESILGLADAKIAAKKVAHIRDLRILEKEQYRTKLEKFDLVLTNSNFMVKQCKKYGIDAKLLYNPIDNKIISKLSKTQAKNKLKADKIILFVGSLERKKGVHIIPNIARKFPDYTFLVVGRGPLEHDYDFILSMPPNMKLCGYIPYKELGDYYKAANILIVPSLWQESFGRVVIEAYANATPVIATKIGGLIELVDKKTGFLVNPNNIKKGVIDIIKNLTSKKLNILSRNAYQKSREFSSHKIIKELIKEYKKI